MATVGYPDHMARATTCTYADRSRPRPARNPNLIPEFWVWQDDDGWHGDHNGSGRHIDGDTLTNLELSAIVVRVAWSAQLGGWS